MCLDMEDQDPQAPMESVEDTDLTPPTGTLTAAGEQRALADAIQAAEKEAPYTRRVNVNFSEPVYQLLDRLAKRRGTTMAEILRVLKPGGKFVFLEFAKPRSKVIRAAYFGWLRAVQPFLGWLFFGDSETYRYIHKSLSEYPELNEVNRELEAAGFRSVRGYPLFMGGMSIHVADK